MSLGNLVRMVCFAVLCANAGQAQAGIISAFDRGWYDSSGFHDPTNQNYVASIPVTSFRGPTRNFFVFNLGAFSTSEIITSASLRLFNPIQNTFFGTYTVYDVSTSIPSLTGGGFGLVATYNDLGTGTSYATQAITSADAGTFVTVNLNAAGLSALNASRGGTFATGGTWSSSTPNSHVFGFNFAGNLNDSSLVYETSAIPEPASLALSCIGALGVGLVARRRARTYLQCK